MASPTWWIWVSVNSGSWWWTGRPGMLRFTGLQRVGHDWADWTEHPSRHYITNWETDYLEIQLQPFVVLILKTHLLINKSSSPKCCCTRHRKLKTPCRYWNHGYRCVDASSSERCVCVISFDSGGERGLYFFDRESNTEWPHVTFKVRS